MSKNKIDYSIMKFERDTYRIRAIVDITADSQKRKKCPSNVRSGHRWRAEIAGNNHKTRVCKLG